MAPFTDQLRGSSTAREGCCPPAMPSEVGGAEPTAPPAAAAEEEEDEEDEEEEDDPHAADAPRKLLDMLGVLLQRGYGKFRARWTFSPSGAYWRMAIHHVETWDTFGLNEDDGEEAGYEYSTASGGVFPELGDASMAPEELADVFLSNGRLAAVVAAAHIADAEYTAWYHDELLAKLAGRGELPYEIADWPFDGSVLNTTESRHLLKWVEPQHDGWDSALRAKHQDAQQAAAADKWNECFQVLDGLAEDDLDVCVNRCVVGVGAARYTLLHHAAYHGAVQAVPFLLRYGAEVNARCAKNETPYMIASRRHPEEERLRELLHVPRP
eukprot:TRINITY_DN8381_c0_g1_i1.p1 TRINITY_DN8381_c0_g1~~TRINITY_DN8381_c0_g1_i1.p1  ORF type:complete len:325 (+),score=85.22 TRINITY_DN8381_c0_g1_i1:259-1233(+)